MGANKRGFVGETMKHGERLASMPARISALALVFCMAGAAASPAFSSSVTLPGSKATPLSSGAEESSRFLSRADALGVGEPIAWRAPENPVFYDRPLMLRQYGYGVLAGSLAGAIGFYIGNAFEGAIFGSDSHKGYLSFTGIRYRHKRGPFWGGGSGLLLGGSLTAFFVGEADEEPGSVWLTVAGGALTTAAAVMLADAAGVQEDKGMLAFIPLVALPPIGAVGGYHVSRWFNDRKRRSITESGEPASLSRRGPVLHAPRLGFAPGGEGVAWRLDALNLTF